MLVIVYKYILTLKQYINYIWYFENVHEFWECTKVHEKVYKFQQDTWNHENTLTCCFKQ